MNYEIVFLQRASGLRHTHRQFLPPETYLKMRIRYVPPLDIQSNSTNLKTEQKMLAQICHDVNASIFVSTFYTSPLRSNNTTRSKLRVIALIHDLIPEALGWDMSTDFQWIRKIDAIRRADDIVTVSRSSERDFRKYYPDVMKKSSTRLHMIYNRHNNVVSSSISDNVDIRSRLRLSKNRPYVMIVGPRRGYKNALSLFGAFSANKTLRENVDLLIVGGHPELESDELELLQDVRYVHAVQLNDNDLYNAYSNALALVYLSIYEGFGFPVLEAMSCGCPVLIWNPKLLTKFGGGRALKEVSGSAALLVNHTSYNAVAHSVLNHLGDDALKRRLVQSGLVRSRMFHHWDHAAEQWMDIIIDH